MTDLVERPLNLVWQPNTRNGETHMEWAAPCGCAYHPEPQPHVHFCHRHIGSRTTEIERLQAENERLGRELFENSILLEAHRQTKKRLEKVVEAAKMVHDMDSISPGECAVCDALAALKAQATPESTAPE